MTKRPTYEQIEKRAYELWEARGRPEGYDSEFWAQAERELTLEGKRGGKGESSDAPGQLDSGGPREPYARIRR